MTLAPLRGCVDAADQAGGGVGGRDGGRCSHLVFALMGPCGVGTGNKFEELKSPYGRKQLLRRRQGQALEGPLEIPLRESRREASPFGGEVLSRDSQGSQT